MLKIYVEPMSLFDNDKNEFIEFEGGYLCLEHSLVSLSKWESKWHKAFLDKAEKTDEEMVDYVRCMTTKQPDNPLIYYALSNKNLKQIQEYIDNPMTATTITDRRKGPVGKSKITTELIYYWMINFGIPVEFEKWHLNRLLTLIRVCDIKGGNSGKMDRKQTLADYKAINAARRAKTKSRG